MPYRAVCGLLASGGAEMRHSLSWHSCLNTLAECAVICGHPVASFMPAAAARSWRFPKLTEALHENALYPRFEQVRRCLQATSCHTGW